MKAEIKILERKNNSYLWNVILNEGKNREIKKIFIFYNVKVLGIHRHEFAGIKLGKLKEGKYRVLKKNEIQKIFLK